jgi:hypothetical protein
VSEAPALVVGVCQHHIATVKISHDPLKDVAVRDLLFEVLISEVALLQDVEGKYGSIKLFLHILSDLKSFVPNFRSSVFHELAARIPSNLQGENVFS